MFKIIGGIIIALAIYTGLLFAGEYVTSPTEKAIVAAQQEFTSHITGCYTGHIAAECAAKDAASAKMDAANRADRSARPEAYKPY